MRFSYLLGCLIGVVLAYLARRDPYQQAARELAAYARGQSDLCEQLYQQRWGGHGEGQ